MPPITITTYMPCLFVFVMLRQNLDDVWMVVFVCSPFESSLVSVHCLNVCQVGIREILFLFFVGCLSCYLLRIVYTSYSLSRFMPILLSVASPWKMFCCFIHHHIYLSTAHTTLFVCFYFRDETPATKTFAFMSMPYWSLMNNVATMLSAFAMLFQLVVLNKEMFRDYCPFCSCHPPPTIYIRESTPSSCHSHQCCSRFGRWYGCCFMLFAHMFFIMNFNVSCHFLLYRDRIYNATTIT